MNSEKAPSRQFERLAEPGEGMLQELFYAVLDGEPVPSDEAWFPLAA